MCEHNFKPGCIVGADYSGTCDDCGSKHNFIGKFQYLGEVPLGHSLRVLEPVIICSCGSIIKSVTVLCGSGGPINVTQEFLSLPVRTK